jgi:hypothetical protein
MFTISSHTYEDRCSTSTVPFWIKCDPTFNHPHPPSFGPRRPELLPMVAAAHWGRTLGDSCIHPAGKAYGLSGDFIFYEPALCIPPACYREIS